MARSETATTATALSAGAVGGCRSNVLFGNTELALQVVARELAAL
jgi:hypothetical protein